MQTFIVTRTHDLDYRSSTVYLTLAENTEEAIIACRIYEQGEEEIEEAAISNGGDFSEDDRESGDYWEAQPFTLPTLSKMGDVEQIAYASSD